jgi:hypothetical protein
MARETSFHVETRDRDDLSTPSYATPTPSNLYPDEKEIARCVLGNRARQWSSIAPTLEREGMPRIDPLTGGRFWPGVIAFFNRRHGLWKDRVPASADGEEAW